jgi:hypothetical protein
MHRGQLTRRIGIGMAHRMRKKAVQQGRNERRGEAYSVPYVEPLNDARTPLADFLRILLEILCVVRPTEQVPSCEQSEDEQSFLAGFVYRLKSRGLSY